jgi:hypothetical protein
LLNRQFSEQRHNVFIDMRAASSGGLKAVGAHRLLPRMPLLSIVFDNIFRRQDEIASGNLRNNSLS